jgi:hypothetical protein
MSEPLALTPTLLVPTTIKAWYSINLEESEKHNRPTVKLHSLEVKRKKHLANSRAAMVLSSLAQQFNAI